MNKRHRIIILSAPSGSGKTTIAHTILNDEKFNCSFSVSATNRTPRANEENGVHYYFYSENEFSELIKKNAFVEWEEVYNNQFYGTLKSEVERLLTHGKNILFDVDVKGGLRLKEYFQDNAIALFIMPPSLSELKKRLENRNTETQAGLEQRILRAEQEITYAQKFDEIIINDNLEIAIEKIKTLILNFLNAN